MKVHCKQYCVSQGAKVDLEKWPTLVDPFYKSDEKYKALLTKRIVQMQDLQQRLYASNSYAMLVIFQGMDASGKDSVIKHVMSGANPQGSQVFSFKHPSTAELEHDFLWRTTRELPERGRISVFNRSYYEDVLIVRVHPKIFLSEHIPGVPKNLSTVWQHRYRSIRDIEQHLHANGTRIVKIFLHMSKKEQAKRFIARIDTPEKNWKFSTSDMEERKFWKEYMAAYEHCICATSTTNAPWYIVPADDKKNTALIVSQIILDRLHNLNLTYPVSSAAHKQALQTIRAQLAK